MKKASSALVLAFLVSAGCKTNEPTAAATTATVTTTATTAETTATKPVIKPVSVQLADSEMKRSPQGWMIDFATKPKWDYTQGLFASAVEQVWKKTGDERYFNYIKAFADTMITENGTILTYKKTDYNIDRVNPGKFLIGLYKATGDKRYKIAVDELRDQMRTHPRTKEGGFWHKKVYPHQMWLDGLYMASPFLAKYAAEYNEPALFDDVANQIYLIDKYTWDNKVGLFYHGWDESKEQKWADKVTGRSPHVWGRAMGWFAMSLVDVLEYFPKDHPKRAEILRVTQKMADAIVKYQDANTGVWWQVVDMGGKKGNYLESSASSMYTYFLLKAVKNGYIDQKYMQAAEKGYKGVLDTFIRTQPDGTISITNVCAVAGLGGTPYRDGTYEYYISEPRRDNDPKAVGPFIMASILFEELKTTTTAAKY